MASSLYEAQQDDLSYKPDSDSYNDVETNNSEISGLTNVKVLNASSPGTMQKKAASYVNYNNIDACEDFDQKVEDCVIDNFTSLYFPLIKKLTKE